ncbi:hypothetical protein R0011_02560 [Lacticaseibacillus rhamnosus R0011]|nr:Hypothetical protein LOCK900_1399 [Lacticaseibacillus rhamnosus LOCK900]EHJ24077.1 hypothetical protein R0011_02560 [Lacticaseibacillus rhamnosus R0011]EHJ34187.1 hypothetical protein HMPREF0541_00721 [Lacticaseibacillus rhamnosus ATCC 21052]
MQSIKKLPDRKPSKAIRQLFSMSTSIKKTATVVSLNTVTLISAAT